MAERKKKGEEVNLNNTGVPIASPLKKLHPQLERDMELGWGVTWFRVPWCWGADGCWGVAEP